jgi:TonB-linked SusC/RagA family outer membrane protein
MQIKAHFHPDPRVRHGRKGWLTKTMLVMRLTGILLFAAVLQVNAGTYAQTVTYTAQAAPLTKVFAAIEKQTGYVFFYDKKDLDGAVPVTVELRDAGLRAALETIFRDQPVGFDIEGNTIVVTRAYKALKQPDTAHNGGKVPQVTGIVTDENGEPLSGASIKLKNGDVVAITDAKGVFKLKNVPADAILVITFTGYAPKTIPIGDNTTLKVSMSLATNKLDEAQVIAYGTTTERLATGDISKVTSQEIEQQPVPNVLEALEGRVPGLLITQNTGLPGGSFTVQIRGQSSLTSGTDPFFVIDGVPYNSETPFNGAFGNINSSLNDGNPLNYINPYDIESVEVLKDADATAIYGSRAANGAILITTKRGKAGKMKVDLSINSGVTSPARDIPFVNTQQYLQMRHGAFTNDGAMPNPNHDYDLTFWDTTRYTNWSKVLLDSHPVYTDAEGSVSGGTSNIQYLVGGGYNHQTSGEPTLLPGDGADERGSVHFNMNAQSPDKRFKVSLTGSYVSDKNTIQSVDFASYRFTLAPDAPALFNPDGSLNWDPMAPGEAGTWTNPYSNLYVKYQGITSNVVGSANLSYILLPGLELKTDLGYTNTQTNELQAIPTTVFDPGYHITSGQSNFKVLNSHTWIVEPQVDYKLRLGAGMFTALAGASFHEIDQSGQQESAEGFISDAFLEDPGAASSVSISSNSSQYKYSAVFGRLNYNWLDKYILTINARRDGSSRFGPGKQFGNFGSVGTAWIFSQENFMKSLFPALSFGKLRGSYGTTGNDQIGDYQYLPLYNINTNTSVPYINSQGLYIQNLYNPELAWELDKKLEGAIELGFLKDRITVQVSGYRNRSGNQLVSEPLSQVTGFGSITTNLPAIVQNSGKEAVLRTINIRTKNFTWSSSFNISANRNKLISYPGLATSPYADYFTIGQPVNLIPVYHMIGVNDTTGLYEFSDFKGNPTYRPNSSTDMTTHVNLAPKYYGGIDNTFTYKGFSVDILFQFVEQTGRNMFGLVDAPTGFLANDPVAFLNAWQAPGDKKPYEQFTQKHGGSANAYKAFNYAKQSDFAYSDASFIRLKNLALSWQLPGNWKSKTHLQNARIFVQGQNLLTFTHYSGTDPESQSLSAAPKRALTFGLQVGL